MADGRLSRAVPFSEFAPDHLLRFTTGDLIALESQFSHEGEPWTAEIERRLKINDATFTRDAVRLAVKKPDGFGRPELTDQEWNDLPFAPAAVSQKIADAIILAITGGAYADLVASRSGDGIVESLARAAG